MANKNTQRTLGNMWSIVGITSLYVSVNICFFVHGSEFFLPSIKLSGTDYYSASFYGIFFTIPLILTTHYLTREYAKHYGKGNWLFNIPVAFNRDLSEIKILFRRYQLLFFFLILLLPSGLHIDFINKFFHGTVYVQTSCKPILKGLEQFTLDFSIYEHGFNKFRFGDIEKGIDYYPIIFPFAVVLVECIHLVSLFSTLKSIRPFGRYLTQGKPNIPKA